MPPGPCPFCRLLAEPARAGDGLVASFLDGYPLTSGHTLVVPRRHVARLHELTAAEQDALWSEVEAVRAALAAAHGPDGFNVGLNDGPAAGQTVPHLHVHVIPRYVGDTADPRGGVRWVVPEKAAYW